MTDNVLRDDHEPDRPVTVRRHPVDWEAADFEVATAQRYLDWKQRLSRGIWYLNPRYTVHAAAPTPAFFLKVREVQGSWLRMVRQSIHNRGLRREARRREPMVRGLAFSGILILDGEAIPPSTWSEMADGSLKPTITKVSSTHRHLDLTPLQTTGDLDPLMRVAQSALQDHLDLDPEHAAFITPHLSLSAPTATPAFYRRAEHAMDQWRILLTRFLGNGNYRRARRSADPVTYSLVFGGVLYANRQLYWPACWPNQTPRPSILKRSPFQTPTVPPSFLGLSLSQQARLPIEPTPPSPDAPKPTPTDPTILNNYFLALFASMSP